MTTSSMTASATTTPLHTPSSTIYGAVQALVHNLQTKMQTNATLTAEEQTLIATAIDKLANHATLEQAVVAVAEEHLDTAQTSLTEALNATKSELITQVTEAKTSLLTQLTQAKQTLNSTLTDASSALSDAQDDIDAAKQSFADQNGHLALLPQVNTRLQQVDTQIQHALSEFAQQNTQKIQSELARVPKQVYAVKPIEAASASGNNQRSSSVFAVYDANGDTFAVRPAYGADGRNIEHNRLEFIKIDADANKSTLRTHYCHNSTFYQSPSSHIFQYGCSALLPLATKNQPQNIAYEVVYSTQKSNSSSSSDYHGVYIRSAGYNSATRPKPNINATDQWGLSTLTSHAWNQVGVLYDNQKHCLVMLDSSNSRIIEKYRDGDVITAKSISNATALQAFVNQGDFTVVYLISHCLPWAYGHYTYTSGEMNMFFSYYYDAYGYFGRQNNVTKMGGDKYSAHYCFTHEKQLQPLMYHFTSFIDANLPEGQRVHSATGTSRVTLTTSDKRVLGQYQLNLASNNKGELVGHMANAIVCINPYSNVGLVNEYRTDIGSAYFGIGRTCKAF